MVFEAGVNVPDGLNQKNKLKTEVDNTIIETGIQIGDILISNGIITGDELTKILKKQEQFLRESIIIHIGEIAIRIGKIDREKFIWLLQQNNINLLLGEYLVINNIISVNVLEKSLNELFSRMKSNNSIKLGELLVKNLSISLEELNSALLEQNLAGKLINKKGFETEKFHKGTLIEAGEIELTQDEFDVIFGKQTEKTIKPVPKVIENHDDVWGNERAHPSLRSKK